MVEMKQLVLGIVGIVVVLQLVSALVPTAVTTVSNTSAIAGYTTWAAGTQAMWGVIAIFSVLAIALMLIGIAVKFID